MTARISVLVVEDEPLLRLYIADELIDAGFDVIEAGNAAEALDLLDTHSPIAAMFTDVDMPPAMDGLDLAAVVRERWPAMSIVVTSGHRDVSSKEMPDDAVFFGKPYLATDVAQALRRP